jgi:hypothetical protein
VGRAGRREGIDFNWTRVNTKFKKYSSTLNVNDEHFGKVR